MADAKKNCKKRRMKIKKRELENKKRELFFNVSNEINLIVVETVVHDLLVSRSAGLHKTAKSTV